MKERNENMEAQEFGKLRAFLVSKGVSQSEIDTAVGRFPGESRAEIVRKLRKWLKTRPKSNN